MSVPKIFLTHIALIISVSIGNSQEAIASHSYQDHGRVNMSGSILSTPCTLLTSEINMGTSNIGKIIQNGKSDPSPFSLMLGNCDKQQSNDGKIDDSFFEVIFDGPSDGGSFILNGVSGVGLQLSDASGNIAIPGTPLPGNSVTGKAQQINYTLRLVRTENGITAGEYHSVLRFKVNYF